MSTTSTSPPPPPSPPAPPPPVQSANVQIYYSGGISNAFQGSSIGGAISQVTQGKITSNISSNLYPSVTVAQAGTGIAHQYRCFYVFNDALGVTIRNAYIWFETLNPDSDVSFRMGLDPAGRNGTPATIANDATAPAGVTFTQPVSNFSALYMGRLNPGDSFPVWLDRTVNASAAVYQGDGPTVRVEGGSQPVPQNVPDFEIAAVGNFSCSSVVASQNVANIAARVTDVPPLQRFIPLGDMGNNPSASCWFAMTSGLDTITHPVIGDLEIYTTVLNSSQPALLNSYLNHYGVSQPYYSFNYGPIHFLILNTEILYTNPSPLYNFVAADLTAAATNANVFWTIAAFHQPFYTVGGTGPVGTYVPASFRDAFHPLFDTNKVDLVLTAHPYSYQRTKSIIWNGATPTIAQTGPNYTNPTGRIFCNVGTGGQQLDSFATAAFASIPSYFEYAQVTDFGYLLLQFTNSSTTLTGTFFNAGNQAMDTFSISKS